MSSPRSRPRTAVTTPALYPCVVRHSRSRPVHHSFQQRTCIWLIDIDRPPPLPRPLRPMARFEARDHFDGAQPSIRAGLEHFLAPRGINLDGGPVLMLAHPRVLGYVFNPLSLFWCHHSSGRLACVVAEVHNTYGERHCYLVRPDEQGRAATAKELYVSPFFAVDGRYQLHVPVPGARLDVSISLEHDGHPSFVATVRGHHRPATPAWILRSAIRHPWPTVAVTARIWVEGLRLFAQRRLPIRPRPHHRPQEGME